MPGHPARFALAATLCGVAFLPSAALADPYASVGLNLLITPTQRIPVGLGVELGAGQTSEFSRRGVVVQGDLIGFETGRVSVGVRGLRPVGPDIPVVAGASFALRTQGGPGVVFDLGAGMLGDLGEAHARLETTLPLRPGEVDALKLRSDRHTQQTSLVAGAGWNLVETFTGTPDTLEGRPLRRSGRPMLPSVATGSLSPSAARWLQRGRTEHASVPAFQQLAAELRALSAPQQLVGRALRAAREEAGHARLCYAEVARRTGRPVWVGPAPRWRVRGGTRAARLARMAKEALVDGIQGEGDAARRAASARDAAREDRVARIEHVIVVEESGHARLAEDVLVWARREQRRGRGVHRRSTGILSRRAAAG